MAKTKPDFASTCEFLVFKDCTITGGLRKMATYLKENGLDRYGEITNIEVTLHEDKFHVCANISAIVGKSFKDLKI